MAGSASGDAPARARSRGSHAGPTAGEAAGEFSKWKAMELPRSVVIGHGALGELGNVCARLKLGRRALVVEDGITRKVAGEAAGEILHGKGLKVDHHVIGECSLEEVELVASALQDEGTDFALGVGGGRPIDVAKCASFMAGIPFVSVPTAASHDGLVSARASIIAGEGRSSLPAQSPVAVVMDTHIIAQAPYRLLAAGCGDILANSTAVKDWELSHRLRDEYFSSYAAALSDMTARHVMERAHEIRPRLEESAWIVCKALVSSGVAMSIAGSSRPASGSEHLFSHALDRIAEKPALHGEQCGVGTIMMMYLHRGDWEGIRDTLLTIGAPTTARALGVKEEEVVEALIHAHEVNPDRYTILGDRGLSHEAAERLARVTKVI